MTPRVASTIARALVVAFVACTVVAQIAEPAREPLRHQISELAQGRAGWVMDVGFACWTLALLTAAIIVTIAPGYRVGPTNRSIGALLVLAALGVLTLTLYKTQTVAGVLPPGTARTTTGRVHDLAGEVTTIALVIAALVGVTTAWRGDPRFAQTTLLILGLALLATVAGLVVGPSVGGLRQRVVVLCGLAWLWLLTGNAGPRQAWRRR